MNALEARGIKSFCPRARAFFENEEVRLIVAAVAVILGYVKENRDGNGYGAVQKLNRFVDESIELLSKYGDLSTWKAVIISDEAIAYNARNRSVRSYEWEQIIIKAGGSKDIEVITSTKPCSTDETPEKYVFLQIESSRGRLKAMITGDVGLLISRKDVLVCN